MTIMRMLPQGLCGGGGADVPENYLSICGAGAGVRVEGPAASPGQVGRSAVHKAVFLDRDGVINKKAAPHQYVTRWEDFRFLPGVPEAIRALNEAGYLVLIVANQRGVARGMMTMEAVDDIHRRMCKVLAGAGARIDGIYVCPHEIGQCTCRKPGIGLLLQAERDFPIDKDASWMVGDSDSDIEAGQRYGVQTILTTDLRAAVKQILSSGRRHGR